MCRRLEVVVGTFRVGGGVKIAPRMQLSIRSFFTAPSPADTNANKKEKKEEEVRKARSSGADGGEGAGDALAREAEVVGEGEQGAAERCPLDGAEAALRDNEAASPSAGSAHDDDDGEEEEQEEEKEDGAVERGAGSDGGEIAAAGASRRGGTKNEDNSYLLERDKRIAMNRERMMQFMGEIMSALPSDPSAEPSRVQKRKRGKRKTAEVEPVEANARRRSTRLRGSPAAVENQNTVGTHALVEVGEEEEEEEEVEEFMESAVGRYECADISAAALRHYRTAGSMNAEGSDGGVVRSQLARIPVSLCCSDVTRAYAACSSPSGHLIGVGGKGGFACVFGTDAFESAPAAATVAGSEEGQEDFEAEPLFEFRPHRGWLADLQFSDANILVTAGNDGNLCGWDIAQVNTLSGMPKRIFLSAKTLHASGIFSMDCRGSDVLTSSKDGSTCLSRFRADGHIGEIRRFDEHHAGVIKCVRYRGRPLSSGRTDVFADCGNDLSISVVDLRSNAYPSMTIDTGHERAVNRVCWHPHDENIILSTSFGPSVLLHDLRRPEAPLFAMSGHSRNGSCHKGIYNACFMQEGRTVVCAGEGTSRISVYSTLTGQPISRGHVGFDASNLSVWAPADDCEFLLASHNCATSAFVCC